MILRFWLISGTLIVGLAWVLTVPLSPAGHQASAPSSIAEYRVAGLVPEPGGLVLSAEIGHDVFEIPETDAAHAAEEADVAGEMPGMDMGGTEMPSTEMDEGGMDAAQPGLESGAAGRGDEPAEAQPPAPAEGEGAMEMPGTEMAETATEGAMPAPEGDATGQPGEHAEATGMAVPAEGEHAEEAGAAKGEMAMEQAEDHGAGGAGLRVLDARAAEGRVGRTVEIRMTEWGFEPANLAVKQGEVIRFVISNAGNTPHEFMFMPQTAMAAVNYRLERADWNLTEHEAIYEQPIVLPGDGSEVVIQVQRPGIWMYMCMFPYHMQFGMMGMMMTEGMAVDDSGMGGMKM